MEGLLSNPGYGEESRREVPLRPPTGLQQPWLLYVALPKKCLSLTMKWVFMTTRQSKPDHTPHSPLPHRIHGRTKRRIDWSRAQEAKQALCLLIGLVGRQSGQVGQDHKEKTSIC